ncbi:Zinc finger C2H2-type [Cinara cedri]|uniref:Zinc finger C2H2-type n=1 Tax=Cinara cedri TaxID=506608 RepID=A0A5E4MEZ1_9HEMI|nr:Zinc finger C2H2-type [Cinara cedri]
MAELDSEDSLDGALVIDEPQDEPKYDLHQIKILESSDSDVEIIEIKDDDEISPSSNNLLNSDSDVEIIEIKDDDDEISPSSDNLINCVKKFNDSLGNCINVSNVQQRVTKRKKSEDLTPELCIKNKRGSPPKLNNGFKNPLPQLIPINRPIILANTEPQDEKKIFNLQTESKKYNLTPPKNNPENNLPSLSQILINEIEPEYPCTTCGQIFRHNIGLICHLNDAHNIITTVAEAKDKKKSYTKVHERKKSIENDEPTVETINLTMLPDLKKDTLLSRMKSYVYSPNKNDVICVLCKAEFKNNKKALAHVEDKHISKKIECGYCNMKFVYELKLRSHMAKRHKIICVLKCEKCAKMINREEYESHSEKCTGQMNTINIKIEDCS